MWERWYNISGMLRWELQMFLSRALSLLKLKIPIRFIVFTQVTHTLNSYRVTALNTM